MLAGSLSQEWQQFFSGLQDSSEYSSRSYQSCSLDALDSSYDFQWEIGNHKKNREPLRTDPSTRIIIVITVILMFHGFLFFFLVFLQSPSIIFSLSFIFTLWSAGTAKSTRCSFLLLMYTKSVFLARIRWSVCILKSQRILCVSFFGTDSGLYIYHLVVWSNFDYFPHPVELSLVLLLY